MISRFVSDMAGRGGGVVDGGGKMGRKGGYCGGMRRRVVRAMADLMKARECGSAAGVDNENVVNRSSPCLPCQVPLDK